MRRRMWHSEYTAITFGCCCSEIGGHGHILILIGPAGRIDVAHAPPPGFFMLSAIWGRGQEERRKVGGRGGAWFCGTLPLIERHAASHLPAV